MKPKVESWRVKRVVALFWRGLAADVLASFVFLSDEKIKAVQTWGREIEEERRCSRSRTAHPAA